MHSTTGAPVESQDPRMREVAAGGTVQAAYLDLSTGVTYTSCSKETKTTAKRHECTTVLRWTN